MSNAPYMTAANVRSRVSVLSDASKFLDETIEDLIAEFAEIAEDYKGVAFTPRTESETIRLEGTRGVGQDRLLEAQAELELRWPYIRTVSSLTIDGTSIDPGNYELDKTDGVLIYAAGFTRGSEVIIDYEHGLDAPPIMLLRACREYVRSCALQDRSTVPRDVIGQQFEGSYTRYATPDRSQGRPTGWLEVDRLLNSLPQYRLPGIA